MTVIVFLIALYVGVAILATLAAALMWHVDGRSPYEEVRSQARREARLVLMFAWSWPVTLGKAAVEIIRYKE